MLTVDTITPRHLEHTARQKHLASELLSDEFSWASDAQSAGGDILAEIAAHIRETHTAPALMIVSYVAFGDIHKTVQAWQLHTTILLGSGQHAQFYVAPDGAFICRVLESPYHEAYAEQIDFGRPSIVQAARDPESIRALELKADGFRLACEHGL